jgi:hypothetical protein
MIREVLRYSLFKKKKAQMSVHTVTGMLQPLYDALSDSTSEHSSYYAQNNTQTSAKFSLRHQDLMHKVCTTQCVGRAEQGNRSQKHR